MSESFSKIEQFDKRFGIIAVEMGYITPADLIEAMKVQVQEDVNGDTHRLIGDVLMDLDKITPSQIDAVLHALFRKRSPSPPAGKRGEGPKKSPAS